MDWIESTYGNYKEQDYFLQMNVSVILEVSYILQNAALQENPGNSDGSL